MPEFKIGDRVRIIASDRYGTGELATVIKIDPQGYIWAVPNSAKSGIYTSAEVEMVLTPCFESVARAAYEHRKACHDAVGEIDGTKKSERYEICFDTGHALDAALRAAGMGEGLGEAEPASPKNPVLTAEDFTMREGSEVRTCCPCSFPHPAHDECDGNPDAPPVYTRLPLKSHKPEKPETQTSNP